jgi:hypothetical protein
MKRAHPSDERIFPMTDPKKTDPNRAEASEAEAGLLDDFIEARVRYAWGPALRMALDSHGAPERCTRRTCRLAGGCRMTWKEGRPLDCGGGITDEALKTAAVATLFGSLMAERIIEEGIPLPSRARPAGSVLHEQYGAL